MQGVRVGCCQITWGPNAAEDKILSDTAAAGFEGAPASGVGQRSGQETVEVYAKYGLKPAPGYLPLPFWRADLYDDMLEKARAAAKFHREAGLTEMYVSCHGDDFVTASGKTRIQTAAVAKPEDSMSDEQYKQFVRTINAVGAITAEQGVRVCYHNHVGFVVETRAEIDRLFSMVDRSLVFLGPDFGHLAWAGVDPVQFARDYADSILTAHLKDINPDVVAQGRKEGWDYQGYSDHGVFAEFGEGCVDYPAIFEILKGAGFKGWIIAETDVTQRPTALDSAMNSRKYLRSLGL